MRADGEYMKKNRLNKINTVITAVLCVLAAVMFWLFANYMEGTSEAFALCGSLRGFRL